MAVVLEYSASTACHPSTTKLPTLDALTTATCSYGQSFTMDVTMAFGQLMIWLLQHRGNIIISHWASLSLARKAKG